MIGKELFEQKRQERENKHAPGYNLLSDILTGNPSSSNPLVNDGEKIAQTYNKLPEKDKTKFLKLLDDRRATLNQLLYSSETKHHEAEHYNKTLAQIVGIEIAIGRVKED